MQRPSSETGAASVPPPPSLTPSGMNPQAVLPGGFAMPSAGPGSPMQSMPSGLQTQALFSTMPPGSMPLGSMPPGSMQLPSSGVMGSASWPPSQLSQEVTVQIFRLLDMPVSTTLFGNDRSYKVVATDMRNKKLAETGPISGIEQLNVYDGEHETVTLAPEESIMKLKTASPIIFLHVQYAGGIGGNAIGRCKIHRQDPRSTQVWPYMLSKETAGRPSMYEGESAGCGIELKVTEDVGDPAQAMASSSGTQPMATLGSTQFLSGVGAPPGFKDPIGISAYLKIDRVTDLRGPLDPSMRKVLLAVTSEDGCKEFMRLMFQVQSMSGQAKLFWADCRDSKVNVSGPVHVGGDDGEGSMYVRIGLAYVRDISHWNDASNIDRIGMTDPIKVTWRPAQKLYQELKDLSKGTQGGIHLSHRLMTAQESGQASMGRGSQRSGVLQSPKHEPKPAQKVSGRTGHFPPGSPEEALEQAILNAEAQNRAMLQRCKKADPHSHDNDPHMRTVNGYREWDSLDTLFTSMGPNPLAMSDEVGPSVCRGYHERENLMKDLAHELIPPLSQADAHMNLELIKMYYKGDPFKLEQLLRPVVCKDPADIKASKDISWCPDPPLYAPLRSMSEEDRETLRLACYDPSQNAKLVFQDINPGYQINKDIWGTLADRKKAMAHIPIGKGGTPKRLKDECLMA